MADEAQAAPQPVRTEEGARFDASRAIILSAWGISALSSFLIIMAAVYMMVFSDTHTCPPVLREWAGTGLGFMFGTCMAMVKDFVAKP